MSALLLDRTCCDAMLLLVWSIFPRIISILRAFSRTTLNSADPISQMVAMIATPETMYDNNWYPDFGMTNHITTDVGNLMTNIEFFGPHQVLMGNVKGLSLRYIGQSMFTSYLSSKTPFLHLFCVPQITKNLLSALQFAKHNITFLNFTLLHVLSRTRSPKQLYWKKDLKVGSVCLITLKLI